MAVATRCQTPDTYFNSVITETSGATVVQVEVVLPFPNDFTTEEAELLERNIHNVLELVLAPLFGRHHKGFAVKIDNPARMRNGRCENCEEAA